VTFLDLLSQTIPPAQDGLAATWSGSLRIVKRAFLSVVAAAVGLTVLSSCATVEPDAAKVGTHHIRIRAFEKRLAELAKVPRFASQAGNGSVSTELAQILLSFEISGSAFADELSSRNITLTAEELDKAKPAAQGVMDQPTDGATSGTPNWDKLSKSTQDLFVTVIARQSKIVSAIKADITDADLQAFYASKQTPDTPPFEQVKDQIPDAIADVRLNAIIENRTKDTKVDPRYGTYYPESGSFRSPEQLAVERAAQAAQNGG
jgi:hypothetical protein